MNILPKTNQDSPENMPTPKKEAGKYSRLPIIYFLRANLLFVSGMGKTRIGNWKWPFSEFNYRWKPVARILSEQLGSPNGSCTYLQQVELLGSIIPWLVRKPPLQRKTWGKIPFPKWANGPTKWHFDHQEMTCKWFFCLNTWKIPMESVKVTLNFPGDFVRTSFCDNHDHCLGNLLGGWNPLRK